MIHVYFGDGKGKTTAGTGLAIRAAGRGRKVLIVRFMKTDDSGEVESLKHIPNITIVPCYKEFGFTFQMNEEQKKQAKEYYTSVFRDVTSKENLSQYDMIVMDEANVVSHYGFVEVDEFLAFLKDCDKEVVLTGRNPDPRILEAADYATELKKIKHPYDKGIPAREGIEY